MRQLVQDEDVAVEQIAVRRCDPKQNRLFPQEGGAGVFHAAVGQTGNEHHVILCKWEWLCEKIGEVLQAPSSDLLYLGSLGLRALELRFAHIERRCALRCEQLLKWSGGKRKQISADRRRLGESGAPLLRANRGDAFDCRVGNDCPGLRCSQFQGKAAL